MKNLKYIIFFLIIISHLPTCGDTFNFSKLTIWDSNKGDLNLILRFEFKNKFFINYKSLKIEYDKLEIEFLSQNCNPELKIKYSYRIYPLPLRYQFHNLPAECPIQTNVTLIGKDSLAIFIGSGEIELNSKETNLLTIAIYPTENYQDMDKKTNGNIDVSFDFVCNIVITGIVANGCLRVGEVITFEGYIFTCAENMTIKWSDNDDEYGEFKDPDQDVTEWSTDRSGSYNIILTVTNKHGNSAEIKTKIIIEDENGECNSS